MIILIGSIIGIVMGLTGAGGALVAIPLFMQFLEMSLKEASVYSLIAVVIASFSNFIFQRKNAHFNLAFILIAASALGSFLSGFYKSYLPDLGMVIILALIAIYSLYSVWVPLKKRELQEEQKVHLIKTISIGFFLGVLTTFTGLGGGVLMLPLLLSIYRLSQKEAVATSLVVVGTSSLISFLLQITQGSNATIDSALLWLSLGILITSYILKIVMTKVSIKTTENLRKAVFTIVVILSLLKIF